MNAPERAARILVVDDEQMCLDLLVAVLTSKGHEVVTASDGELAWQRLSESGCFDVLIIDRCMPNLDGMQLLQRLRGDARFREMPVIFQSGMDSEQEIIEGLAAGVFYYLVKPYTPGLLSTVTSAALVESAHRQRLREELVRQTKSLQLLRSGTFSCQTLTQARELAALLAGTCSQTEAVVNGLAELLINAVEHGNLGISYEEKGQFLAKGRWLEELEERAALAINRDKTVTVNYLRTPDAITIVITDMGKGFDWRPYLEFDPARATHAHGRGIALARLMSFSSLEYQGCGNKVAVTIDLT